jgi:hypothetical protein
LHQALFCHNFAGSVDQADEHLHDFWFDPDGLVVHKDGVDLRLDLKLTDLFCVFHAIALRSKSKGHWNSV